MNSLFLYYIMYFHTLRSVMLLQQLFPRINSDSELIAIVNILIMLVLSLLDCLYNCKQKNIAYTHKKNITFFPDSFLAFQHRRSTLPMHHPPY